MKVYALCQGYSDNCTYTADYFDSVELFYNEQDALYRQAELEDKIPEEDKSYYYVNVRTIVVK
jgi:hypothetical protein